MNILELLENASKNLKWPRYTYFVDNTKIVFSRAGPNAKFPGSVNITDGRPYGEGFFYGRVFRMKDRIITDLRTPHHKELIEKLIADPIGEGALHGQKYAFCCFCSTELTSKASLAVGYGPICAGKWGLPWGETEDHVKDDDLENL